MDKKFQYEPSRHLVDFHIEEFNKHEGLDVINELVLGTALRLVVEPDNPFDSEAIAIYFKNKKLGYVPNHVNPWISKFLYFGHTDIFEARIQFASKEVLPERQFKVVIKIKDNRDISK